MKKTLVALMLALALLVSCVPVSFAEELEPVTLNVWVGGYKQKDSDRVWEAVNEKLAEYLPNTALNITAISFDEYAAKWSKAMAAGEQIDVAWLGWVHDLNSEVAMGSLLELDELIAEYGQDMLANYGQDVIDMHKIGGASYFIPNGPVTGSGKYCMVFPKELLEAAGMPNFAQEFEELCMEVYDEYTVENVSRVIDKLEEYLAALKAVDRLGMGSNAFAGDGSYGPFGQTWINNWNWERNFQVNWGDNTFTVESIYIPGSETYEIRKMEWERFHDWWEKGYIRQDYLSAGYSNFGAGYAFEDMCAFGGNQFPYDYENWTKEEVNAYYEGVYGWPVEIAVCNPVQHLSKATSTGQGIPYTSKNPERAMMLINLLHSEKGAELQQLLAYGFEGEHYTVEDGVVTFVNAPDPTSMDSTYGLADWSLGTNLNKIGKDRETVVKQAALTANAVVNPLAGFVFDTEPVSDEWSNVTSFTWTNLFAMCTEDWDVRFEEAVANMDAAGITKVQEEMQRQLNEYLAENNITEWPDRDAAAGK